MYNTHKMCAILYGILFINLVFHTSEAHTINPFNAVF